MRISIVCWTGMLAAAFVGCGSDQSRASGVSVQEFVVPVEELSLESDLLARPGGVVLDSSGRLYVLDRLDRRVLSVTPEGRVIRIIGRPGPGPGDFTQPRAIGIARDRLLVFDISIRAVHEFTLDGEYIDTRRLNLSGAPLSHAFAGDGRFAYSSFPATDSGLVSILDSSGQEAAIVSQRVSDEPMAPETMLPQLQRGEVPGFMRNRALPFFGDSGSIWVFLQSEGILQRYGADGGLSDLRTLSVQETTIRQDFFSWYAGLTELGGIRFLDYLDAGAVVSGNPWLLWKTPLDRPGLITVHDRHGSITARLVLVGAEVDVPSPDPNRPPPNRRFAVDAERRRLYLVDDQSVVLRVASLPAELFR